MQYQPKKTVFDTEEFSVDRPVSPLGSVFSYCPPPTPEALHYHDFLEIGFCEHGSGIFYVNGQPVTFSGRCSSIIYGGETHIAQSINPEGSLWHFLYIDLKFLFSEGDVDISFLRRLLSSDAGNYSFPSVIPFDTAPDIYGMCMAIINCAGEGSSSLDIIRGMTYSLLKRHEQFFVPLENPTDKKESMILRRELESTINYITEHFMDKITVEELLPIAGMSRSNLQRKMTAYTGRSPMQYVQYVRMKQASVMLMDRERSISSVAMDTGYTLSCFNRQFMKEFGMSPSQWRKANP